MTTELLIIDPQMDFCDPARGALYVGGAEQDIERLSSLVESDGDKFDRIHVTLDSHNALHIAHPIYWQDASGSLPEPFTTITAAEVESGRWRTSDPAMRRHGLDYVRGLEREGRYQLVIWPYHCLIGSEGHNVMQPLREALERWEKRRLRAVDYIFKGNNPHTEHYSAVRAEMPMPDDPNTQTNPRLLEMMRRARTLVVAGEAGSHCVANTVRDLVDAVSSEMAETASKIVLLTDATCPVAGFKSLQDRFIAEMTARGMRTSTTKAFAVEG